MTSPKPIENKFKLGQKVRTKWINSLNVTFTIDKIELGPSGAIYAGRGMGFFNEDEIEEVKEPLRVEFECEWIKWSVSKGGSVWAPCTLYYSTIEPFIGLRTRVVIEEIVGDT